jgi:hypothetical protein
MRDELKLSAEKRLLLLLLRRRTESPDKSDILSLFDLVNWAAFLNIASEDLYPMIAYNLEPYLDLIETPQELARLHKTRRFTAAQNLLLRHELGRILRVLQERGIPALALKGIVLAHSAYPDLSLRPMTDLDLLVPPGRREEAVQILHTIDYKYPEGSVILNRDFHTRLLANQEFAPPLRFRASTALVEIHTELECSKPLFPMPIEDFWSRSIAVDLNDLRVGTLCPEDFLFHVCLHLSRSHRFEKGLLPLVDIRVLLESRQDWNWEQIAERSLQYGCATWMYITLEAARDLLGAAVPDDFFHALPRPLGLERFRHLLDEQAWSAIARQHVPPFVPHLLAESSWQKRARMILGRTRLVEKAEGDSKLTFANLARLAVRRLLATFRSRIPMYVNALRAGKLKLSTLRRQATLLQASNDLFQQIEEEAKRIGTSQPVTQSDTDSAEEPQPQLF